LYLCPEFDGVFFILRADGVKVNPAHVIPLMEISRTPGKTEKIKRHSAKNILPTRTASWFFIRLSANTPLRTASSQSHGGETSFPPYP